METLSKEQREIERNAAYEALHYAYLQSLEILKPDATTRAKSCNILQWL